MFAVLLRYCTRVFESGIVAHYLQAVFSEGALVQAWVIDLVALLFYVMMMLKDDECRWLGRCSFRVK
eukprot:scaffold703_cov168-Amphora_coffeaeformis.AAC.16